MSIEYVVSQPIIDVGFLSLDSSGVVNSPIGEIDEVLVLRAIPGNANMWRAEFENPPAGVNALYNHNAMMKIRTSNYSSEQNIYLDGFYYPPPSWIQIVGNDLSFTLSQQGYYFVTMTYVTTSINTTANLFMTQSGSTVGESIISFLPSRINIDGEIEKISCTSSFFLEVTDLGFTEFNIKISPRDVINLQGTESFISFQQVTRVLPPP